MKKVIITSTFVVLAILCACLLFYISIFPWLSGYPKIKKGFSSGLVTMLEEQYDLKIPESATFSKGFYEEGLMKDPCVYIAFVVPHDELENMLGIQWKETGTSAPGVFDRLDVNAETNMAYEFSGAQFTFLCVSDCNDEGNVVCGFQGRHPNIKVYKVK